MYIITFNTAHFPAVLAGPNLFDLVDETFKEWPEVEPWDLVIVEVNGVSKATDLTSTAKGLEVYLYGTGGWEHAQRPNSNQKVEVTLRWNPTKSLWELDTWFSNSLGVNKLDRPTAVATTYKEARKLAESIVAFYSIKE